MQTQVTPRIETGLRAILHRLWDRKYVEAKHRLLELTAPLISQMASGELQLPYVIEPEGGPITSYWRGLSTRDRFLGYSIRRHGEVHREIVSGPLELRYPNVPAEQPLDQERDASTPIAEIVYHAKSYYEHRAGIDSTRQEDRAEKIVQLVLKPGRTLDLGDVVQKSWNSAEGARSISLSGASRKYILTEMIRLLEKNLVRQHV